MGKKLNNLALTAAIVAGTVSQNLFGFDFYDGYSSPEWCPEYIYETTPSNGNFYVGADWLYWELSGTNLEFANHATIAVIPPGTATTLEPLRPAFDYTNGYRIEAGYICDCNWKLGLEFTHIPTQARRAFAAPTIPSPTNFALLNTQNFPIFISIPGSGDGFVAIAAEWESKINYLDLDASYCFDFCRNLSLSPHLGIRNLWIHNSMGIAGVTATSIDIAALLKTHIYGVGVEGGIQGKWQICRGFSIVGNVGGAVLYSHFTDKQLVAGAPPTPLAPTAVRLVTDIWRGVPMFDAFIGVQYENCFSNYTFNLRAGWEKHIFLDTVNFSQIKGAITTEGLTLGGLISF